MLSPTSCLCRLPDGAFRCFCARFGWPLLVDSSFDVSSCFGAGPPAFADGLRLIRSGLAASDRIVIDGLQRARPGQKVKPEDGVIAPIEPVAKAQ